MKTRMACSMLLAGALLSALGCGGGPAPGGPAATVQQFYDHLNSGAYAEAKALYSAEVMAVVGDPEITSDADFRQWAEGETKSGGIAEVEIVDSAETEGTANVSFEIHYDDGSTIERSVELTQEAGQWRLGFIS
jgi:hypothetical protein